MKKLIYFTSPWCEPCETLGPIMNQVAQKISVEKINIDYETDRAVSANVRSIPAVILVENGQELRRFVGLKTYNEIIKFING